MSSDSKSLVHIQSYVQVDKNIPYVKLRDHIVGACSGKLFVSSMNISGVKSKAAIIKYCSKEDYNCLFSCRVSDLHPYSCTLITMARMSDPSLVSPLGYMSRHNLRYYLDTYSELKAKAMPEFGGFKLDHLVHWVGLRR